MRRHHKRPRRVMSGFTIIELMVTTTVAAIMLMVAVPAMTQATLSTKLSSYSTAFTSSIRLARSEAIKRNSPVSLCASSNGTSCNTTSWSQGWVVLAGTTVIAAHEGLANGFQVKEDANLSTLNFSSLGGSVAPARFNICYSSGSNAGHQERVVTVTATGKASTLRTNLGNCPTT